MVQKIIIRYNTRAVVASCLYSAMIELSRMSRRRPPKSVKKALKISQGNNAFHKTDNCVKPAKALDTSYF